MCQKSLFFLFFYITLFFLLFSVMKVKSLLKSKAVTNNVCDISYKVKVHAYMDHKWKTFGIVWSRSRSRWVFEIFSIYHKENLVFYRKNYSRKWWWRWFLLYFTLFTTMSLFYREGLLFFAKGFCWLGSVNVIIKLQSSIEKSVKD